MAKYTMNFYSLPKQFVGEAKFSPKSTLNGKAYSDMNNDEKAAFRKLFLDAGATSAEVSNDDKYEYNYFLD